MWSFSPLLANVGAELQHITVRYALVIRRSILRCVASTIVLHFFIFIATHHIGAAYNNVEYTFSSNVFVLKKLGSPMFGLVPLPLIRLFWLLPGYAVQSSPAYLSIRYRFFCFNRSTPQFYFQHVLSELPSLFCLPLVWGSFLPFSFLWLRVFCWSLCLVPYLDLPL